jgi:hypothetical protein
MLAFAIFSFFMTLLSLGRIDKYTCIRMQNAMCTIVVVEHKWSAVVPIVVDNNTFSQVFENVVWCISQKKFAHFYVCLLKRANLVVFNDGMEFFCCSWFNYIIESFVSNTCFNGFDLIFISCDCSLNVSIIVLGVLWCGSRYTWSFNIYWRSWLCFSTSKMFFFAYFIR